jgi:hypothetical protein
MNPSAHWHWIRNAEIDATEDMNGGLSHNFDGEGYQAHYKWADMTRGHVTVKVSQTGARVTDCAYGSSTCPEGSGWANHNFDSSTTALIRDGSLLHNFVIDYWNTKSAASLTISDIKLTGGNKFASQCRVATPI